MKRDAVSSVFQVALRPVRQNRTNQPAFWNFVSKRLLNLTVS